MNAKFINTANQHKTEFEFFQKTIRQIYSVDDELAINRQKDSKPDEFQEYFDYCEWAKAEAAS